MHIEKALDFIYQHGRSECDAFDVVAGVNASSGISVFQGKLKDTEISNSSGSPKAGAYCLMHMYCL